MTIESFDSGGGLINLEWDAGQAATFAFTVIGAVSEGLPTTQANYVHDMRISQSSEAERVGEPPLAATPFTLAITVQGDDLLFELTIAETTSNVIPARSAPYFWALSTNTGRPLFKGQARCKPTVLS